MSTAPVHASDPMTSSKAEDLPPLAPEIEGFHEALALPPAARLSMLQARHPDDPDLVQRILRLIEAHERAEATPGGSSSGLERGTTLPTVASIGPYRVLETLGEGGMGRVFAAEQLEPIRRRVAIKVLKLGLDTPALIARFEAERQALALLDHPCIATVFDAGVTEESRPYFVMELVKGLPIVEYCQRYRLALAERLRLFLDVCEAVQHAHRRGIIHRDLKPSNILVALQEGRPVPKVIDFGVAKSTSSRLSERPVFTEMGQLIGTPEYMSPEQAEMSSLDVDTRTDVYSLGVILYELLTGVLPLDSSLMRSGGFSEILRVIREVEPMRPSTRLVERLGTELQGEPRTAPDADARALQGELDWIVMRAIEKDRTRRYRSPIALGEDIERYLLDYPVQAGPPSLTYRVRKFVRRHRVTTALLALALLSCFAGLGGLSVGLLRARTAEAMATQRADNAQAAADFLERILFQADPEAGGESLSLLQVMSNAGGLIEAELGPFPEVAASVHESLGVAYRRRSMFREATPHLLRSLEIRQQVLDVDHADTAASRIALADLRFEFEGNVEDSLFLLERAQHSLLQRGLADSAAEAWLQLDLGIIQLARDDLAASARSFERCRKLLAETRGAEHADISRPLRGLALVALRQGDSVRAEDLARRAVSLCAGEDEEYIDARAKLVLARVLVEGGRLEEAASPLQEAGAQFARSVGTLHIRIAEHEACRAELLLRKGDFAAASESAARCQSLRARLLHEDHPAILESRLLVLRAQVGAGTSAGAESTLSSIVEAAEGSLGSTHPLVLQALAAQVEFAESLGDDALSRAYGERLSARRARRSERLSRNQPGQ